MAVTDRAFRALGRDEPATLVALVRALDPALLPWSLGASAMLSSADARPDRSEPWREVDLVLQDQFGPLLWHLAGQGYADEEFLDRVLRYHMGLALQHWEREVRTVAVWLRSPVGEQREPLLRKGAIRAEVSHLILPEFRASLLEQNEHAACFAPAADDEGRGDQEVCQRAVATLQQSGASLGRWQMAAVAACSRSHERYRAMVDAMSQAGVRSVIIEDLIKIGEELGYDRGMAQGFDRGRLTEARGAVRRVLELRGLAVSAEQLAQLEACSELIVLQRWHDLAIVAASAADILGH